MLWPVVACTLLWMSVGLFGHEPFKPDEAYTVGLVKSVVDSGDWVVPRLVGEPFMEKPPLFFDTAALFVKALPWLPLHEAARVAVLLFVGLGLLATGAAARSVYGEGRGRLAVLLTLATVGTVVRLHQLITDTALFAGMAIGLLGLVRVPAAPRRGGMLVGAGVAIAFLSKGLLGPGLLLCTAAALACIRPWRGRPMATAAVVALLVATPPIAAWLAALELQAPDQMRVWFWDNNIGRFAGLNALGPKQDPFFYLGTLSWYALPCWPLALWGLVGRRGDTGSRAGRDVLAPLLLLLIGLAVLSAASDGRELYALVLVPALALLATGGLLRLAPRVERRMAVLLATVLLLLCGVSLLIWAAAMFRPGFSARLPVVAAAPSMTPPSTPAMLAYAVVAALWLAILATQRRGGRGSLPLAGAAGLGLLWASIVLPWSGQLDALKGYRAPATALQAHLPGNSCVASRGLGEGERALLDYFIGLRTLREESNPAWRDCDALLVQSLSAEHLDPMPPWRLRWEGTRSGRDTSVLRLYVR